jgi:hypothetical protein
MEDHNLLELKQKWGLLKQKIAEQFEEEPDLQTILFLIGVQELGQGSRKFTKDQKMDLMHIATCRLLSHYGYYELESVDNEGWPHWKQKEKVPFLTVQQQDWLLKEAAVEYFMEMGFLE